MRKIFLSALCAVMIFSPSVKAADYDPLNTVCALNFAIVSVNRILAAHDRITLKYEYNRIINRLAIGNIEGDQEMTALYSDLMNFITGKNIRDEERKRLVEISCQLRQEAYYRAISKSFENVRTPEQGNLFGWIASFFVSAAASTGTDYNDYQAAKEQIKREIDTSSWELTKQEIEDCNKLQVRLLNLSWRLMSQYKIPNEYRLTHENVREFLNIMNERDPSKRLGRLKFIERKFRVYPPYWYFRANAALESGNESECRKCYEKFNEVWRPVLNFYPYKLEAVKYEIRELAKSESPDISKIKSLVETVRDYTSPEDWDSNIFAGIVYYALGDRDEAINCIEYGNIASGLEQDISGVMLAQMKSGEINVSKIMSEIRILFDKREFAATNTNAEIKEAAEGGYNGAQYYLGLMHEYGQGVPKDLTEARKWYKMDANKGDDDAKDALERLK